MAKHYKKNDSKYYILMLLELIFFIMLMISSIQIAKWYKDNKKNDEIGKILAENVNVRNENDIEVRYEIDFKKIKEINNDAVAFLKVEGTNIEIVVVKGKDNDFYLNHNFEKEENKAGWIFADYRNKLDGTDKNIVIYGHNMKDGSMFGSLKNILNAEWYNDDKNMSIRFITESEQSIYEVFSIYEVRAEEYYIQTEFDESEYENFLNTIKDRSVKEFNVDLSREDKILTLSTCASDNKYRVVLHCKKTDE